MHINNLILLGEEDKTRYTLPGITRLPLLQTQILLSGETWINFDNDSWLDLFIVNDAVLEIEPLAPDYGWLPFCINLICLAAAQFFIGKGNHH